MGGCGFSFQGFFRRFECFGILDLVVLDLRFALHTLAWAVAVQLPVRTSFETYLQASVCAHRVPQLAVCDSLVKPFPIELCLNSK